MTIYRLCFFLCLLSFISACATLDKDECQIVDWRQLGDRDGQAGYPQTRLGDHAKACEKHGIAVDRSAYDAGWRTGIQQFCTPQNGFTRGRSGAGYAQSCPSDLAGPFLAAYTPTKRVYEAQKQVERLERLIDQRISEIQRLAGSSEPEDKERLQRANSALTSHRIELANARSKADAAQRDLNAYLRANPQFQGF